jgi:hypothetical protein
LLLRTPLRAAEVRVARAVTRVARAARADAKVDRVVANPAPDVEKVVRAAAKEDRPALRDPRSVTHRSVRTERSVHRGVPSIATPQRRPTANDRRAVPVLSDRREAHVPHGPNVPRDRPNPR